MLRRGMKGKPLEYARFLWLIHQRGLNVTLLALQLNGRKLAAQFARAEGAQDADGAKACEPKGRSALNEVLLGRRTGKRTWMALRRILNAEEHECIARFAAAEVERRERAGLAAATPYARLRSECEALKREVAALRMRLELEQSSTTTD